MDKPAIKKFAVWARNKLIADTKYRAGLVGVTETAVAEPEPDEAVEETDADITDEELEAQALADAVENAIEVVPDDADAWYVLGESLCKLGETEEGFVALTKARSLTKKR